MKVANNAEHGLPRLPDEEITNKFGFVLSPIPKLLFSPDSSVFLPLVEDEILEFEMVESVRVRPPRLARASEIRPPAPLVLAPLVTELDGCEVDSRPVLVTGDVRPLAATILSDVFKTEGNLWGCSGTLDFDITHRVRENDVRSAQPG